jgi:hypothetical protein
MPLDSIEKPSPAETRQALIKALHEAGLTAHEYHSGGGNWHVVTPLYEAYDDAGDDLVVSTTDDCDAPNAILAIGLMGYRGKAQVASPELCMVESIADAVLRFKLFVASKHEWLERYHQGALDV